MRPKSSFNKCTHSLRVRKLKCTNKIRSGDKRAGSSFHQCMLLYSRLLSNLIGQILTNILSYNEIGGSNRLSGFKKEPSMMMMMMMMMNCFCGMADRRKAFSLISSREHCQRSSPSRISDKPRVRMHRQATFGILLTICSHCFNLFILFKILFYN